MSNPRTEDGGAREPTVRDGIRLALPLVLPTLVVGISFGVAARALGWGWVAPTVMSVVVFSGSAQFASTGVLAAGGSMGAAIVAATLFNLRFLPMGVAAAPATRGGWLRRAAEGQAVVDTSLVIAMRDGTVHRGLLLGSTIPQFVGWVGGTAIGAGAGLGADGDRFGIDVIFPAFFLILLAGELRGDPSPQRSAARRVAAGGALLALALIPIAPPGVPVLVAILAAVLGLRR